MLTQLEKVLAAFKGTHRSGRGWKAFCPCHQDKVPSLSISVGGLTNSNKILIHCNAGCRTGDVLKAVGLDWSDLFSEDSLEDAVVNSTPIDWEMPSVEIRDMVYRAFLSWLHLSDRHIAQLKGRGLREPLLWDGYKTLEVVEANKEYFYAVEAARRVIRAYGSQVFNVPGFKFSKDNPVAMEYGLVIPVKNDLNQIQALMVRQDGVPKYRWFGGNGSPSVPHGLIHVVGGRSARYRVTEGILKANVIYALDSSWPVLACSGVGNWSNLRNYISEHQIEEVEIAFDMDYHTNPGVADVVNSLEEDLRRRGTKVEIKQWPVEYNGLDDWLASEEHKNWKKPVVGEIVDAEYFTFPAEFDVGAWR